MSKNITVCFSASGVTKRAAQLIADTLNTELIEITPKTAYTKEDLNWRDKNSRSTLEMSDKSSRPEITNEKVDLSGVDTVFLGFPVWWYIAPTIVNTFLEANDLSGKRIVLFATSGGSDFGKTVQFLKNSVASDTVISEGRVFSGRFEDNDVVEFARQYI
ncbi:flavodoxin [Ruminococcus sp. NK3A76]|uniref:flavodoxin n=1 Tax=Ruminococcus sp. NK3A76 TaxID=877411 RepID=UPI00048F587A|nr:flavodoxin [Ruminococcus sp. NK3A76]